MQKVNIDNIERFPRYELYYYYEGKLQKNINHLVLKGAPVIFVPGNAGSYKQVRKNFINFCSHQNKLFDEE